jgi:hypothetical protein
MNGKWKECTDRADPRRVIRKVMSSGEQFAMSTGVERTTRSLSDSLSGVVTRSSAVSRSPATGSSPPTKSKSPLQVTTRREVERVLHLVADLLAQQSAPHRRVAGAAARASSR